MSFLTTELRIHKRPHYVQRQLDSHYSRAKAEHIAIIMFAALMRGIRVAAEGRANTVEFISRHGGADTTTADQYANLGGSVLHFLAIQQHVLFWRSAV